MAGGKVLNKEVNAKRLTLLNAGIITDYGTYRLEPISLADARALVAKFTREGKPIQSAIGHKSTADLLSTLLGYEVVADRLQFTQTTDDLALVFKLARRPPEGAILTREELEACGYELALLTRLA